SAADGRAEIQNGLNEAQFMVIEAVDPNTGGGSVSVTLYCGGAGTIASDNPQTVTEASPGEWTVTGLSSTATCTATEDPVPAGYTADQSDCANRERTVNASVTCTIVNIFIPVDVDIVTSPDTNLINLGGLPSTVTDTATVTYDGSAVEGSVDFYVCYDAEAFPGCATGGTQTGDDIELDPNGQADSDPFEPTQVGYYCFRAEFTPADSAIYRAQDHTDIETECFRVTAPDTDVAKI